ncbi:MAG TPA: ABC transporter substrate-binding protein [Pseudolabrys sp.]|nr:ABC transporter substrate-binding protein [Pseudolabrys sp.]
MLSVRKSLFVLAAAASAASFTVPSGAKAADMMKLTATAIGRPPIFSNTFADVGEAMGFWKKAGLDVTFRWFQRGTDTAKAVVTGDASIGFTATPPAVNLIASGAKIKIVAGQPNQDWVIASDDVKDCKGLKGKTVAADGINNTRYLYLQSYLATCGLKISDVNAINLANTPLVKAGIAKQVHNGVFHIDELAQVEHATKKWNIMDVPASIAEGLHYAVLVANDNAIKNNHEALVRFLVGWIETQKMMSSKDPKTMEKFAEIAAKAKNIDKSVALNAIKAFQAKDYWVNNDGLNQKQMMSQVNELVKVGSMKAKPPTYDQLVDTTLYAEAAKRVDKMSMKK